MTNSVFRIEYPTGYMELNIRAFFATATKKQLKKVLRLAKQNCSEEQRKELLINLLDEVQICTNVIEELDEMIIRSSLMFQEVFEDKKGTDIVNYAGYTALVRRRDRLKVCVDMIEEARWEG